MGEAMVTKKYKLLLKWSDVFLLLFNIGEFVLFKEVGSEFLMFPLLGILSWTLLYWYSLNIPIVNSICCGVKEDTTSEKFRIFIEMRGAFYSVSFISSVFIFSLWH